MAHEMGFDRAEVVATLRSLVAVLEDPDPRRRIGAYTTDAIFVMEGSPVHGRAEMLARGAPILYDVTVFPERIEGCHRAAVAYGRFTCFLNRGPRIRVLPWRCASSCTRARRTTGSGVSPTNAFRRSERALRDVTTPRIVNPELRPSPNVNRGRLLTCKPHPIV
jgi:hypothetical protein